MSLWRTVYSKIKKPPYGKYSVEWNSENVCSRFDNTCVLTVCVHQRLVYFVEFITDTERVTIGNTSACVNRTLRVFFSCTFYRVVDSNIKWNDNCKTVYNGLEKHDVIFVNICSVIIRNQLCATRPWNAYDGTTTIHTNSRSAMRCRERVACTGLIRNVVLHWNRPIY